MLDLGPVGPHWEDARMSEVLNQDQIDHYNENGYLLVEERIPGDIIDLCLEEIEKFRVESRELTESNSRIDLEDSHTPDNPRVRRIKWPHKNSRFFGELMRSDLILAPVRDLIGKNLRLHTSKINLKSAEYGAPVEWHQDWAFYPHTNDDVLAVGVMLDDVGLENGPLLVFPGSHKGEIFDHHSGGIFTGAMDLSASGLDASDAVKIVGPRGSISIHHARIVHGSDLNRSERDRQLLFYEITAADAFPIVGSMSPMESLEEYDSRLLCGEGTIMPRVEPVPVRIPLPRPEQAGSIYDFQGFSQSRSFDRYEDTPTESAGAA